jgi:hypothetical protein
MDPACPDRRLQRDRNRVSGASSQERAEVGVPGVLVLRRHEVRVASSDQRLLAGAEETKGDSVRRGDAAVDAERDVGDGRVLVEVR